MIQFTKQSLIEALQQIHAKGWIESVRAPSNAGAVGNTLETLLGITENNLPIANAAEWELKAKRRGSSSLVTLFHMEPSPTSMRFVPEILLPNYGWGHVRRSGENSFRQTINAVTSTDRGFKIVVNRIEAKIEVSFNAAFVAERHATWLSEVAGRVGLGELNPQPYWGFNDLEHKIGSKLTNTFFVLADSKKQGGKEYFFYNGVLMLKTFSFAHFLLALEEGVIYVDFDASTTHNHGTKIRLNAQILPTLYAETTSILDDPMNRVDLLKLDVRSIASVATMIRMQDMHMIEQAEAQGISLDEDD